MNETTVGHLHNRILLGYKKEDFTLCDSIDGLREHYVKLNKPVRERKKPYNFTHLWNLMNKLNSQGK